MMREDMHDPHTHRSFSHESRDPLINGDGHTPYVPPPDELDSDTIALFDDLIEPQTRIDGYVRPQKEAKA